MPLVRTHEEWLSDGKRCFEAALEYLALGWAVIPLCPPDHIGVGKAHLGKCTSPGKAPLIAGWASFEELPTVADVNHWWRQWPNANVGIVMGRISGLVGLDIDGETGERLLARMSLGLLPPSCEFHTPGGRRLLYAVPSGKALGIGKVREGKKMELRLLGEGSQTVAPPSRHLSGAYYEWTVRYV